VIVRVDKSVVFDRVVQVLDVAKNAAVESLGIAIQEKAPPTERNRSNLPPKPFYPLNFIRMIFKIMTLLFFKIITI
jgi:hypothetical protein